MTRAFPYSVTLTGDSLEEFLPLVPMAEAAGFQRLGIADTQSLTHDVYMKLTLAALHSSRILLHTGVTNPVTRHPTVTAGAIATLNEISHGRAVLGIGTGDSALYNIGMRPARVEDLRDYIVAVRELLERHETAYQGKKLRLTWNKGRVPIYVAASGPKTLRMAGAVGDGVIVGTGVLPEVVADAWEHIAAGAKSAGRRLEDIDVWWLVMGGLSEDAAEALEVVKYSLTTYANLAFRFTTAGKHLPKEFESAVRRIHQEYRPQEHVHPGEDKFHSRLADETGFTQYLASRFAVAGTPKQFADQARRARAAGAKQLWFPIRYPNKARFFRLWTERVAPLLEQESAARS